MLNLLRFRVEADYGAGGTQPSCSGKEAYSERYVPAVTPMVLKLGARIVWSGVARGHPVCLDDERWDDILIVEYPGIEAAALENSRLIAMEASPAAA